MIAVLQQVGGGMPVGDVCRQVGIFEQTFYRWKKAYAGMLPSEAHELKQLREHGILKALHRHVGEVDLAEVTTEAVAAFLAGRGPIRRRG